MCAPPRLSVTYVDVNAQTHGHETAGSEYDGYDDDSEESSVCVEAPSVQDYEDSEYLYDIDEDSLSSTGAQGRQSDTGLPDFYSSSDMDIDTD